MYWKIMRQKYNQTIAKAEEKKTYIFVFASGMRDSLSELSFWRLGYSE